MADVFVFNADMNTAMHSDIVVGEIIDGKNGKKKEKPIDAVERSNKKIIGTLKINENFSFVMSDDPNWC